MWKRLVIIGSILVAVCVAAVSFGSGPTSSSIRRRLMVRSTAQQNQERAERIQRLRQMQLDSTRLSAYIGAFRGCTREQLIAGGYQGNRRLQVSTELKGAGTWQDPENVASDERAEQLLYARITDIEQSTLSDPNEEGLLACRNPRYVWKQYPADMLFQSMFGEMARRDPKVNPVRVAASLGFVGERSKTLETGCEHAIDFHFLNARNAAFALDNYIFRLKKQ
ncbi:MAG: hypothetical protein U0R19_08445 [Bryobacteraceae bacterium]